MTPSCRRTCHLRRIRELDIRIYSLYPGFRLSVAQAIHKYAEESSNSEKLISTNSQMKIELVVIAGAIARVRFPVRLLCAGYVFWQQRLKHSPKLQWRTKILGTVMENLPSTSLTCQKFRYRDWPTPPPPNNVGVKKHF